MTIHYDTSPEHGWDKITAACGINSVMKRNIQWGFDEYYDHFNWEISSFFSEEDACKDCLASEIYKQHVYMFEIAFDGDLDSFDDWKNSQ